MASLPRLPPEERARLKLVRPEEGEDARRWRRAFVVLIVLSLLVHVGLLIVSALFAPRGRPNELALDSPPVSVQFVESPAEPPMDVPPEADLRSETGSRAESPEPTPPPEPAPSNVPRSLGNAPVPELPRPQPSRRLPARPAPEPESRGEPREDEQGLGVAPPQDDEERRQRLQEGLAGLGSHSDWSQAAADAPDLKGGAFGGSSLMFESTADVDWGPYAEQIKRIVRSNWRIAPSAQWLDGVVQVHFYIRRDGTIEELAYTSQTGIDPLDIPAHDAIRLSDPLPRPPLPEDDPEERVGVTWSFLYNVDDREYRKWERDQRWKKHRAAKP